MTTWFGRPGGASVQYRSLTRHFARSFLDNDVLAPNAGMQSTLAPLLAGVVAPGFLLPAFWSISYGWPFFTADEFQAMAIRHELILVVIPMVVVGLATALQWEALYPDERDRAILGLLPVGPTTILFAKLSALGLFLGAVALASNGLSTVCYPLIANVRPQPGSPGLWRTLLAHLAATFGAAGFAAFAVLAVPGALQVVLPVRAFRTIAPGFQFASVLALVLSLMLLPLLVAAVDPAQQGKVSELVALHRLYRVEGEGTIDWLHPPLNSAYERDGALGGMRLRTGREHVAATREVRAFDGTPLRSAVTGTLTQSPERPPTSDWIAWVPPLWFVGWYEELAGRGTATTAMLAARARASLSIAVLAALFAYAAAYGRHATGPVATGPMTAANGLRRLIGWVSRPLLRRWIREPVARATCAFALKTLLRSAPHRLILAVAAGAALGLTLADWSSALLSRIPGDSSLVPLGGVLAFQPVLVTLLLIGTRVAFTVPTSLPANWAFRLGAPAHAANVVAGGRRTALLVGVVVPLVLLAPLHALVLGWRTAAVHLLFGLLNGLVLIEVFFAGFESVPFAAEYVPGRARLRSRLLPYVFLFHGYVVATVGLEAWSMAAPGRFAATALGLCGLYAALVAWRRRRLRERLLVYEGEELDAFQTLGLTGPPLGSGPGRLAESKEVR